MGSFSCCFHVNDHRDSNETCKCLFCGLHTFVNKYCAALFKKDQTPGGAPSDATTTQAAVSSISSSSSPSSTDDTLSADSVTTQPRTLRFECDHHNEGSKVMSNNKLESSTTHCCLGNFALRSSPFEKDESDEVAANSSADDEDEDFCPTCLEEYTDENPKIVTQCCHHYHLSCIYEWMERSPTCPICSKVMIINETD